MKRWPQIAITSGGKNSRRLFHEPSRARRDYGGEGKSKGPPWFRGTAFGTLPISVS